MLKVFRNGRYSTVIAISALILAIASVAFGISDAYASRTTTLAKALQSVGLCPAPGAESSGSEQNTAVTPEVTPEATPEVIPGTDGQAGTDGKDGVDGADGAPGPAGPAGANGADGATGATGATGPAGICDLSNILEINGNLIPAVDNVYSLGTATKRWKDLHVGPGTIYIQETADPANQVAISVQAGALRFEGAQALKVGNIRLSATGITSETPNAPITLGDNMFNSFIQLQSAGLKFKDGTVQSTAAVDGATGPAGPAGPAGPTGPRGLQGIQGPQGEPGTVEGFIEVPVCIDTESNGQNKMGMFYGICEKLGIKGTDITMLQRK